MYRPVEIRNKSNSELTFAASGDYPSMTIAAHGRLLLSNAQYVAYALENDLSTFNIDVQMTDVDFRNVSVKDFGARGDGIHDDTYFIQQAIDSVSFYGGGTVRVPVGVYLVSGLILTDGVSLEGQTMDGSVLKLISGSTRPIIAVAGGSSYITDLMLRGDD